MRRIVSLRRSLDRWLAKDPSLFTQSAQAMYARQRELESFYGGKLLPSVPDPLLVDRESTADTYSHLKTLIQAFEAEARAWVEDGDLAELGFSKLHAHWVQASYRPELPVVPIARVDGMWGDRGRFQLVEINTDGSTGIHDAFALGQAALDTPLGQRMAKTYDLAPASLYGSLANSIRDLHRRFGKSHDPRVAIVDWREIKSGDEQKVLCKRLGELGIDTVRLDPRDLRRKQGRLFGPDGPIDVVYKRVLTAELLARKDEVEDYVEAVLQGEVAQYAPFSADVVYDKGFLAWMRKRSSKLSPEVREALQALLPETHWYPGSKALEGRLRDKKDQWVLKPRTEYGGRGVVLGPEASQAEWEEALEAARAQGKFLVQRFLKPPLRTVKVPDPEFGFREQKLHSILGVWVIDQVPQGLYFRAGPDPVINVCNGAFGLPVLFGSKRSGPS